MRAPFPQEAKAGLQAATRSNQSVAAYVNWLLASRAAAQEALVVASDPQMMYRLQGEILNINTSLEKFGYV